MLVLVTYDVSLKDNKGPARLRRISKQCQNYGIRVQNSVFECRVDAEQYVMLKHAVLSEMSDEDSVRFYMLGNNFSGKVEHYGKSERINLDDTLIL